MLIESPACVSSSVSDHKSLELYENDNLSPELSLPCIDAVSHSLGRSPILPKPRLQGGIAFHTAV